MLIVPEEFNRNSKNVTSLMTPEESGTWLLERLRARIGLASLETTRLLDLGCGVRFTQAILNRGLAIGEYCGLDSCAPLIEFLQAHVHDPRFTFHHFDAYHPLYNRSGTVLSADTRLPVSAGAYDVATMFSVITHQYPPDARAILHILKRHVNPTGYLFFTCFLDERLATFEDRDQQRKGGYCVYNPTFLSELIEESGWKILSLRPAERPLIGDSFLLTPT